MNIFIADSWFKRAGGLLVRRQLKSNEALWLAPCRSVHTFGMRYEIAVFFLDQGNRVIDVRPRVPPNRVVICMQASSVCEMLAITTDHSEWMSELLAVELSRLSALKTAT